MKRKSLVIIAAVLAGLLLVIVALPFFIDVNQFKPTLETGLSSALGRRVEIGNIQLAIFSGGVSVDNVFISDDPAFSSNAFLKAKQLTVGVNLLPLIFSKKLEVRSLTVTGPEVSLLRSPSGTWNFSNLGARSKSESKSADSPGTTNFSVEKLAISNGRIIVGTVGAGSKASTYTSVNLEASNLSYTTQFLFQVTANTPGNGAVKLNGKAGPINQGGASLTPLDATISVQHLDVASTGFVNPSSGIAGLVDFNGNLNYDGRQMNSKGTVKADKMKLLPAGSASQVPINIDYDTGYDLKRESGVLKQGDVRIGKALAHLTGTYDTAGAETALHLKLEGQGMSVSDLEGVLPAVGLTLPSGATLQSGTLDASLAITGPVNKLAISGPVKLSNGKLAGFNLKSKLGVLGAFTGLGGGAGPDTDIQTLTTGLVVDPEGTHANHLNLVVPSIGTITGNGNVSASGQLDCKMVAKLATGNPIAAITSGISLLGGSKSQGGIPFKIQGTTSKPVFLPDIGGTFGNTTKGGQTQTGTAASTAQGIIGGLAGKKKKPQ